MSMNDLYSSFQDLNPFAASRKERSADAKAENNLNEAKDTYQGIETPKFNPISYQAPIAAGDVSAERAGTTQMAGADAGPSAYNRIAVDPSYTQAQMAQMAALKNLQANGGRSAASDANLAAIQSQENQNAKGQRDAILQNAAMRGQGGSGASLLAQLNSSQGSANRQSAQNLGVLGQQGQLALQAGQGAAQIGSNLHNQAYGEQANQAAANDAISRFNAQNSQQANLYNAQAQNQAGLFNAQAQNQAGLYNAQKNQAVNNAAAQAANQQSYMNQYQMPQASYQNDQQKAHGVAGTDVTGMNYYGGVADRAARTKGNLFGSVMKLGGLGYGALSGAGGGGAAAGGGSAGLGAADFGEAVGGSSADAADAMDAAEMGTEMAAWGGRVPGAARVSGDSLMNDTHLTHTSPGEVVVPRSVAMHGTKNQIGSFVQHPPAIGADRNKEAMLSAIQNIRRRNQ